MALHRKTLWTVDTRAGSSLDVSSGYGGLTAGCMTLPESVRHAQGFRVYTDKNPNAPEDYASINALVTGLGGSQVVGLNLNSVTIEFSTASSNGGSRGILQVDGWFDREFSLTDNVTKGEAMQFMRPHGLSLYSWTGSKNVAVGKVAHLTNQANISMDGGSESTTLQQGNLVAIPPSEYTRGIIATAVITGEFQGGAAPYHFRMQVRKGDGIAILYDYAAAVITPVFTNRAFSFPLYTNGLHDELSTNGFKLSIVNDDPAAALVLKKFRLVTQSVTNPDFTLG